MHLSGSYWVWAHHQGLTGLDGVMKWLWRRGGGAEHVTIMLSSRDQARAAHPGMMPLCLVTKLAPQRVLEAVFFFFQTLILLVAFGGRAHKFGYGGRPKEA